MYFRINQGCCRVTCLVAVVLLSMSVQTATFTVTFTSPSTIYRKRKVVSRIDRIRLDAFAPDNRGRVAESLYQDMHCMKEERSYGDDSNTCCNYDAVDTFDTGKLHFDGVVCLLTGSQCGMDSCGSNRGNLASTASGFEHTVTSQLLRERECCALSLIADSVVGQLL